MLQMCYYEKRHDNKVSPCRKHEEICLCTSISFIKFHTTMFFRILHSDFLE